LVTVKTKKPLFVTIPHSGEKIPPEAPWLSSLPEPVQMRDVDRFVNRLYSKGIQELDLPCVIAEWHRYVVDLNRLPADVDQDSVEGAELKSGTHTTGFHWVKTTLGESILPRPLSREVHARWVKEYFEPFHAQVRAQYKQWFAQGFSKVYQIDAHSMPSKGTSAHRDPGETRAPIVVSDQNGKSCETRFKDLVIEAYEHAGFKVAYNWPYIGGRVTQTYGRPELGQHCIQVEMNRALYMDEETKKILPAEAEKISGKVALALRYVYDRL
jgi:N-formylglutamate amidohydrolase